MAKRKAPSPKRPAPARKAIPKFLKCPCCLCGWVYVVNGSSSRPEVRRSCPKRVKVDVIQPGEYVVTFPGLKGPLAPVATLNNSVGTITAVPGEVSGLAPNQVRVLTLTLSNTLSGAYDFTLLVAC